MNTLNTYLKSSFKAVSLILLTFLFACSNTSDRKVSDDFEQQKEELVEGLEKLQADIDDSIDKAKDKLNIDEGPVERNWEKTIKSLEDRKKEVQASLKKAESTNEDNWDRFKGEVSQTTKKIEKDLDKIGDEIADALDGDK